jgi:DNA-binding transcriptional LysR family regulator
MSASLEARWIARNVPEARVALRCHSVLVARAAAVAGFGLVLLPCSLGDERPELRRLAIPEDLPARPIWLLVHPDLRATPRVRAVMDYFAEQLEQLRPRLLGQAEKATKRAPSRRTGGAANPGGRS